jgi:hypothetical protein
MTFGRRVWGVPVSIPLAYGNEGGAAARHRAVTPSEAGPCPLRPDSGRHRFRLPRRSTEKATTRVNRSREQAGAMNAMPPHSS